MKKYVLILIIICLFSYCKEDKQIKNSLYINESECCSCYNGYYDNVDSAIVHYKEVEYLSIHRKQYNIIPNGIEKLKHLKGLSISNQLNLNWSNFFEKLSSLDSISYLNIENCRIFNLMNINKLKNLKEIVIIDSITQNFPVELTYCHSLVSLVISCPIKTVPKDIYKLVNLKNLTISIKNSKFPFALLSLSNLNVLNLSGSCIDSFPSEIGNLKLKDLWLNETPITDDFDKFYKALEDYKMALKIKLKREAQLKKMEKILNGCRIHLKQAEPPL